MTNPVQQSGKVTPGHLTTWVTDGVVNDGGPVTASDKVLATLFSADFNSTFDQPLLVPPTVKVFQLTGIIITNASISLSTAQGGFYTAPVKGGSAIVSAGQVYSALTGANLLLDATLSAFAQSARFSTSNLGFLAGDTSGSLAIYFSLTVPQGAICTADIYLTGLDLTP